MAMRVSEGENYQVQWDEQTATVVFAGSLRLSGPDAYGEIRQILEALLERESKNGSEGSAQESPVITLDLRKLKFLNSSGISMISKYVISVRQQDDVNLTVLASDTIPWQKKSLKNLQRLMPRLDIVMA